MTEKRKRSDGGIIARIEARADTGDHVRVHHSYETDFVLWTEDQAQALRAATGKGSNLSIDWEKIAEEIESLGQSERRALASQVRNVLEHLAKLEASPAEEPREGWQDTVLRARSDIEDLLEVSPSLRRELPEIVTRQLPRALKLVASSLALHNETSRVALDQIRYTVEQTIGDWLPLQS